MFDYEAAWITQIQPQGRDFRYFDLVFQWYSALRRLGIDIDIVPAGASLAGYRLVAVPSLPHVSEAALAALREAEGVVLFGPRTGSKTRDFAIPAALPPGPVQDLMALKILQVGSLRPGFTVALAGEGMEGTARRWREWLATELPAMLRFADGSKALVSSGNRHYLAAWTDDALLTAILTRLLGAAGVPAMTLPEGVRLQRRGALTFALNFGTEPWEAPCSDAARFRIGGRTVPPRGLSCWDSE